MKKLVLSLAMAACLVSGAQAAAPTQTCSGFLHAYNSEKYSKGNCSGSAQVLYNATQNCIAGTFPNCTTAGCAAWTAGTATFFTGYQAAWTNALTTLCGQPTAATTAAIAAAAAQQAQAAGVPVAQASGASTVTASGIRTY